MKIKKRCHPHILLFLLAVLLNVSCEKEDEYIPLVSTDFHGEWRAEEINGQSAGKGQLTFFFHGSSRRCIIEQYDTEQLGKWSFCEYDGGRSLVISELDGTPDRNVVLQITWCSKSKKYLRVKCDGSGDEILLFKWG
ncbi:MAG: hypothetical protein NC344_04865 [Bacteroidales bacterium]|nr:hypothetical protein [Bacteroidales bacterium]MCM1147157.1 hypothetical protein [Bacteroidales bacterium]MCM1205383.1 hypothetical protein [Bacillota bacterium]MCM1509812.1 hypothetical protein [Clostridium sp.]